MSLEKQRREAIAKASRTLLFLTELLNCEYESEIEDLIFENEDRMWPINPQDLKDMFCIGKALDDEERQRRIQEARRRVKRMREMIETVRAIGEMMVRGEIFNEQ
jgi:hypothetical protein